MALVNPFMVDPLNSSEDEVRKALLELQKKYALHEDKAEDGVFSHKMEEVMDDIVTSLVESEKTGETTSQTVEAEKSMEVQRLTQMELERLKTIETKHHSQQNLEAAAQPSASSSFPPTTASSSSPRRTRRQKKPKSPKSPRKQPNLVDWGGGEAEWEEDEVPAKQKKEEPTEAPVATKTSDPSSPGPRRRRQRTVSSKESRRKEGKSSGEEDELANKDDASTEFGTSPPKYKYAGYRGRIARSNARKNSDPGPTVSDPERSSISPPPPAERSTSAPSAAQLVEETAVDEQPPLRGGSPDEMMPASLSTIYGSSPPKTRRSSFQRDVQIARRNADKNKKRNIPATYIKGVLGYLPFRTSHLAGFNDHIH